MLFEDVKPREATQNFKKTEFLSLKMPGKYVIRFLEKPVLVSTHFVNEKYPIKCLGEACPICANNKTLRVQNPDKRDNMREIRGYLPRADRYMLNVYDKTEVKTCPNCKAEVHAIDGNFPPVCNCGTYVINEKSHPSNRIKVFSLTEEKAVQVQMIEKAQQTETGEPISLNSYDLVLLASISNKKMNWTPMANVSANAPLGITDEQLKEFLTPKEKFAIVLTPEEISSLLKGISLRDIFLTRKVDTQGLDTTVTPETHKKTDEEVQNAVNQLFS